MYWDVLWYGVDHKPHPIDPYSDPVCIDRNFSTEGAHLVHTHVRRRRDIAAIRGLYVSLLMEIEKYLDHILHTRERCFGKKLKEFECKIKRDKHWGPDAKLFMTATDILREARNIGAHAQHHMSDDEIKAKVKNTEEGCFKFNKIAKEYGCGVKLPPVPLIDTLTDLHVFVKGVVRTSKMAIRWIHKYSELQDPN